MLQFLPGVRGRTVWIGVLLLSILSASVLAEIGDNAQHRTLLDEVEKAEVVPLEALEQMVAEIAETYLKYDQWNEMVELLQTGARLAERQGDWMLAQRWLRQGLVTAKTHGFLAKEASVLDQMAELQVRVGVIDGALRSWELAASRYREASEPERVIGISLKLAIHAAAMGDRESALGWVEAAHGAAILLGDLLWVARADHHRAWVYFVLAGVDVPSVDAWVVREREGSSESSVNDEAMGVSRQVAMEALEGAIRQYSRLRDYESVAECLRLKAGVMAIDGSSSEVRSLFFEAKQSELRMPNAPGNAHLRLSEARYLYHISEPVLAMEQILEAVSVLRGKDRLQVQLVYADWLLEQGDLAEAEALLDSLGMDPQMGKLSDVAFEYQRVRSVCYFKRGEYAESIAAMSKYADLRLADMELRWAFVLRSEDERLGELNRQSEEKAALFEAENNRLNENQHRVWILTAVGFGGLVLLSGILSCMGSTRLRAVRRKLTQTQESFDALDLRLRQYNEERNMILRNLSQELRTPMSGIIGVIPLLQESSGSTLQENCINIIDISSRSILTLIEDLADFAKIEAGDLSLQCRPMNLVRTVEAVAQVFRADSKSTEIELVCEVPSDPLPFVIGDAGRIQQVLLNLVARAFRTTRSGSIHVRLDTSSEEGARVMEMRITVEDTGESLDAASIEQVFHLSPYPTHFHTVAKPSSMLGMSITRQVVETMGAKLSLSAMEAGGMRAEVILPLSVDQASMQTRPLEPYIRFPRKRALVIAYHEGTRRLICRHLRLWGMQQEMAEDLDAAQPYLAGEFAFDMVFLDLDRSDPGLNLSEKIHAIRQSDCNRMVPIVLMAPLSDWTPPSEIFRHRYLHRVSKPILVEELHYTVRLALTYKSPLTRSYASFSPAGDCVDGLDSSSSNLEDAMDDFHFVPYILPFRSDAPIRQDLKILLAEDNAVNQKVTSLLLRKIGFAIDIVSSGTEAVDAVRHGDYDVVLMDKLMPSMDGLEATMEIRKLDGLRQPVIIALTASASMEDEIACRKASMDNFLSKPVRYEKMKAALAFASSIVDQRKPKAVSTSNQQESS